MVLSTLNVCDLCPRAQGLPEPTEPQIGHQKRLERLWWPREGGTDGSVVQLGLDTVDQPPQGDIDPARHLLPLEVTNVVRGLDDDVASQLGSLLRIHVSGQVEEKRMRVLVRRFLVAQGVAEHESRHGLRFEDG